MADGSRESENKMDESDTCGITNARGPWPNPALTPGDLTNMMLADRYDLYNVLTGDLLMPDMNADGTFYGLMTANIPYEVWLTDADDVAPGEHARATIPAPGSGCPGRMGFVPADDMNLQFLVTICLEPGWVRDDPGLVKDERARCLRTKLMEIR